MSSFTNGEIVFRTRDEATRRRRRRRRRLFVLFEVVQLVVETCSRVEMRCRKEKRGML